MYAIVGIPGSCHHKYRHFTDKNAAQDWLVKTARATLEANPSLGSIHTEIISDREAARRRWADGGRIYRRPEER